MKWETVKRAADLDYWSGIDGRWYRAGVRELGHALSASSIRSNCRASKVRSRIVKSCDLLGRDADDVLSRIDVVDDLSSACDEATMIIEAGPENIGVKLAIFAELSEVAPSTCILATNTSAIPIGTIAQAVDDPLDGRRDSLLESSLLDSPGGGGPELHDVDGRRRGDHRDPRRLRIWSQCT